MEDVRRVLASGRWKDVWPWAIVLHAQRTSHSNPAYTLRLHTDRFTTLPPWSVILPVSLLLRSIPVSLLLHPPLIPPLAFPLSAPWFWTDSISFSPFLPHLSAALDRETLPYTYALTIFSPTFTTQLLLTLQQTIFSLHDSLIPLQLFIIIHQRNKIKLYQSYLSACNLLNGSVHKILR